MRILCLSNTTADSSKVENLQKRSKTCKCARKPKKSSNVDEIEAVLDDSGPLLYMESVLSD